MEKILLLILFVGFVQAEIDVDRLQKHVSIFNVIKFPNDPCSATDERNGTCYTEAECQDKQGTSSGSCAEGYGVCCVFTIRCGQTSGENCTYFMSSGTDVGACNAKICSDSNVCQLRLDFSSFLIAQPSTSAIKVEKLLNGVVGKEGIEVVAMGQCLTDTFSVTVPGGPSPPVICGDNGKQHIYVDASAACNILSFQLAGTFKSSWDIKVTQYKCDYNNLAPSGCTQYYYGLNADGNPEGTFQSFNYVGGLHLAKQNQNVCVRREKNMCRICYGTADTANSFDISKGDAGATKMGLAGKSAMCCGYGTDGKKTIGYDCVIIPNASKEADAADIKASEFCGRALGSMLGAEGARTTVCSKTVPFQLRFLSDNFEFEAEAAFEADGFEIAYKQTKCA